MPLYDVLAIVRASLPRAQVAAILRKAAGAVYDAGGVMTDVRSYGVTELAYKIRAVREIHEQVRATRPRAGRPPQSRARLRTDRSRRTARVPPAAASRQGGDALTGTARAGARRGTTFNYPLWRRPAR